MECFGGGFNVVRFPSKRLGADSFSSAMLDFSDFISEHNLIDFPLEGGTFTWSILEQWLRSLGLTGFFYLLIWKSTFLIFIKKDCIDYF